MHTQTHMLAASLLHTCTHTIYRIHLFVRSFSLLNLLFFSTFILVLDCYIFIFIFRIRLYSFFPLSLFSMVFFGYFPFKWITINFFKYSVCSICSYFFVLSCDHNIFSTYIYCYGRTKRYMRHMYMSCCRAYTHISTYKWVYNCTTAHKYL